MNKEITKEQIAWLAGFFEGEGSITHTAGIRKTHYWILSIGQHGRDREILEYIQKITGVGNITKDYATKTGTVCSWRCTRTEHCEWILSLITPYLFSRRRAKIEEIKAFLNKGT